MYGSWVERIIRKAQDHGKLEPSEGVGKPIAGLAGAYDPAWWAKRWVATERACERAIDLQHRIDTEVPRLPAGSVSGEVEIGLKSLNAEIQAHNGTSPGNSLPLLDVGQLMNERDQRSRG